MTRTLKERAISAISIIENAQKTNGNTVIEGVLLSNDESEKITNSLREMIDSNFEKTNADIIPLKLIAVSPFWRDLQVGLNKIVNN